MKQVVKRIIRWREILGGKLLDDTRIGSEYEVTGLGHVLVTPDDFDNAQNAGDNPLCRVACYKENKAARQWAILGFGSFRWLDC
jgi:hypothetical protein